MKRLLDAVAALVALILVSPVMLLTALAIRVSLGSPMFFRQTRPGLRGKPFLLVKFRTMLDVVDRRGNPLPDADRLTAAGRALRASSLDELPQLWNVLKGDMSLVGPRPLLMEYLPLYSDEQARRNEVRPGVTGWAQVKGRNALSWDRKFELDIWYVDHRTVWLDIVILALTVVQVFRRSGISAAGEATMPRFTGSPLPPDQQP